MVHIPSESCESSTQPPRALFSRHRPAAPIRCYMDNCVGVCVDVPIQLNNTTELRVWSRRFVHMWPLLPQTAISDVHQFWPRLQTSGAYMLYRPRFHDSASNKVREKFHILLLMLWWRGLHEFWVEVDSWAISIPRLNGNLPLTCLSQKFEFSQWSMLWWSKNKVKKLKQVS